MKQVFFYGLFMDVDLLQEKSVASQPLYIAYAEGYGLRIGARASLVPSTLEKAYGLVMEMNSHDTDQLYSDESVADYEPIEITVTREDGTQTVVCCYNLAEEKLTGQNLQYATDLSRVAKKVGLPTDYVNHIKSYIAMPQ